MLSTKINKDNWITKIGPISIKAGSDRHRKTLSSLLKDCCSDLNITSNQMIEDYSARMIGLDESLLENSKFVINTGVLSDARKVPLPNNIMLITTCKDFIFFVTYDDVYSIKFVNYRGVEDDGSREFHDSTYYSKKYQKINVNERIIGIQSTSEKLIALTINDDNRASLKISKWAFLGDQIVSSASFSNVVGDIEIASLDSLHFLVVENNRSDIVLFYNGIQNGDVFLGVFPDGQKIVEIERDPKLSSISENPNFLFTVKQRKKTMGRFNSEKIEFVGIEKNRQLYFKYDYAISRKDDSKLLQDKNIGFATQLPNNVLSSATAIIASKIILYENIRNSCEVFVDNVIFLATEDPMIIYIIHTNNIGELCFTPLIGKAIVSTGAIIDDLEHHVNSLCVVNGKLLVYGNTSEDIWKVYVFPKLLTKQDEKIKSYPRKDDYYDS